MYEPVALNIATVTALLLWPVVSLILFKALSLPKAIGWTIIGGQMLLPVGAVIKLPVIPGLDKNSIPSIVALVACIFLGARVARGRQKFGIVEVLLAMYVIGPLITSILNDDAIRVGFEILPQVGIYDGISSTLAAAIWIIPFLLGRRYMRSFEDNTEILRILVFAGLAYSILLLIEMRFSPQFHYWLYGYSPSQFAQSQRDGGYRPMAFMGHGLIAAFFMMTCAVAAGALWRGRILLWRFPGAFPTAYLSFILIMCKSFGALLYGIIAVPMIRWLSPRTISRVSLAMVIFALLYPMLRGQDLVPTNAITSVVNEISADRAASLQYRFDMEDKLLNRAYERPIFGWGRYGRSLVYDQDTGRNVSVTDGRWIIDFGQFGWFGFIAEFGLLSIGVFRAFSAVELAKSGNEKIFLAALSLIVAIGMIELLPNATITPWTMLVAGCLLGRSEALLQARKAKADSRITDVSSVQTMR